MGPNPYSPARVAPLRLSGKHDLKNIRLAPYKWIVHLPGLKSGQPVWPFIELNYGLQEKHPRLTLPVRKPENIVGLTAALEKMILLGLGVETSGVRRNLDLPDLTAGTELLAAPQKRAAEAT